MKYASIDIGTNAVLLLVADYKGGRLNDISDLATITRLGEGLKSSGILSQAAMDRTFGVLARYKEEAHRRGAEKIISVGTAAVREAANSDIFIRRVHDELGISIRTISAREEAYYTYLSVAHDGLSGGKPFLIVDVGGGSTEIIEGDGQSFADFVSLPVGSVKLTEMFIANDPPTEDEISRLTRYLRDTISAPFDGRDRVIVGTAGTATNLAVLALGLETFEKEKVHGLSIRMTEIEGVIEAMKGLSVEERRKMKGMEPGRADILLQGIILIREIMSCFGAGELVVSANGGRYGVLYEEVRRNAVKVP